MEVLYYLLVSGRRPEFSDCLSMFMEHNYIKKLTEIKQIAKSFFFKIFEFFNENYPPTHHIEYKSIGFTPCNKSIMASKLL